MTDKHVGERVIEVRLATPLVASRHRFEFAMPPGIEVGLAGWDEAHRLDRRGGTGTGLRMVYAPSELNRRLEHFGIDSVLSRMARLKLQDDESLCLRTTIRRHGQSVRLAEILYVVEGRKSGKPPMIVLEASVNVEAVLDQPRITTEVTRWAADPSLAEGLRKAKEQ